MECAVQTESQVKTRKLGRGEILWIRGWRGRSSVRCLGGELWVTQSGDATDYVLACGDRLALAPETLILAEALQDSVVGVD